MKKILFAASIALILGTPVFADQYMVVRTEVYDGEKNLQSIDWKDWDYFNGKDLLFPAREGMSNGREFTFKYDADAAFTQPAKRTAFLIASKDGAPTSATAFYSQTVFNYSKDELLLFEFTTYSNGDKEAVTYKYDAKRRISEKAVEFTSGADKTKTSAVLIYAYSGDLKLPSKVSSKDGTSVEESTFSSAGVLQKKSIFKDGALQSIISYSYNEQKLLSEALTADAAGEPVSREKYFYGMYKPFGEVKKNIDDWSKRYVSEPANLEAALKKYYFTVARNPSYNDQLRSAYYSVANAYFKKEQFETAADYYKKAISYGKSNVTGSDDILILRRYLYSKWDLSSTITKGTEPFCAYNIACCYSRLNRWDEALLWLDFAWQIGFSDAKMMMADTDLQYLKLMKEEEFSQIKDRKWTPPQ